MSEEALNQENEEITTDSFFGVKHDLVTPKEDVEVEVLEEESNLPDPEDVKVAKEPEVKTEEVVLTDEDLDKEITDYSERAGKRINQLKYEFHEERRAKEASAKEKNEAVARLKTLMDENARLQKQVDLGSQELNKTALQGAQWAEFSAQQQLKAAQDEGDAEKIAQATQLLTQAQIAKQNASQYAQRVAQHIAQQQVTQTQEQPVAQPQVEEKPQIDPLMEEWSNNNPWFMGDSPQHQSMSQYALFLESQIRSQGIPIGSKQAYDEIDKGMRNQFPEFFGVQQEAVVETEVPAQPQVDKQASTVVAPVSRTTGKTPRKVQLTAAQVRLARQLGITPEQYANQLLKEN